MNSFYNKPGVKADLTALAVIAGLALILAIAEGAQ